MCMNSADAPSAAGRSHIRPAFAGPGSTNIVAAYTCGTCETQGRDTEVSPGQVLCWNCGGPALITARVTG